jgi:2-oxoisovalerate dehydrogenase E1 component beta subunit
MATVRAVFRNGLRHARILKQQPGVAPYSSIASADRKFNKPIDYATSSYLAHSPATALANKELPDEVRKTSTTKKMNLFQAINDGLSTVLDRDEKACVFGEDVAFGG